MMKLFKTKAFILPVTLILTTLVFQFVINKKYSFTRPHAFDGKYLYNPYKDMDTRKWKIANFHAHTREYLGITNGAANSDKFLDSYYRDFGYNIIGISNYQNIDSFEGSNKWFIPEYEHGYLFYKNHQLVLNAKKVSWLDYFFRQTLSNKQNVINRLKEDTSAIVTIVHPAFRKAYRFSDLKYLGNYDCFEIVDKNNRFTQYYDTILSAGHPVFLLADDDTHDLEKKNDGCQSFNLISTDLNRDSILHAIRTGCLIGVNLKVNPDLTGEAKKSEMQRLPEITGIDLKNDTLKISLSQSVKKIRFIGQKGIEKKSITNAMAASYFIKKDDTYIRTEIECKNGTVYYLNPVFRYNGASLADYEPKPDLVKTWTCRVVFICLVLTGIMIRIRHRFILRIKRPHSDMNPEPVYL